MTKDAKNGNNQIIQMLPIVYFYTSFESIVVGICLLFSLFPDLPGSLHQEI